MVQNYEVYQFQGGRRVVIALLPSFEAAKAYVESLGVIHAEDDPDFEGCADAFLKDHRVVSIEPQKK